MFDNKRILLGADPDDYYKFSITSQSPYRNGTYNDSADGFASVVKMGNSAQTLSPFNKFDDEVLKSDVGGFEIKGDQEEIKVVEQVKVKLKRSIQF